jgi:hypothetical protein
MLEEFYGIIDLEFIHVQRILNYFFKYYEALKMLIT